MTDNSYIYIDFIKKKYVIWKPDLNVLYQVCIFRADQKTKMAAQISRYIFDFYSATFESNWT